MTGTNASTAPVLGLVIDLLPLLLFGGVLVWFLRRSRKQLGGGLGGIMGIGRSKAKVYDEDKPTTRFGDIAGYEGSKAEVMEVVDFLKYPKRYAAAGAVGPKGVLMVGPPGTGKTLMARAVAGEAGVPFFALSGSSFVEMFVGVGASRVRDLFADARKAFPLHYLHQTRSTPLGAGGGLGGFGSNDEREQIAQPVCCRTWTASSLGPAWSSWRPPRAGPRSLSRLGVVAARAFRSDGGNSPSQPRSNCTAILGIHGQGKKLAHTTWTWTPCPRGTPGFSGADLANLVQQKPAINAVRDRWDVLTAADFDAAQRPPFDRPS